MASRGLGSLTLDLIARIAGFEQGMDKAARHANKRLTEIEKRAHAFGRGMGNAMRSAAGSLLAFAGATVGVAAGINAIKSAIDRADSIRDLSIRLGISTEKLSGFSYAAKQTGTDIEDLNKGLLRLSKNAAAALDPKSRQANLFEALGVSKDALTDLDKLVPQVADAFGQIEDGATKAALAQELFGRSGANLIEFLNQGSAGLAEMADRAAELGVIIDTETAAKADEFNDTLEELKAVSGGFAQQVAADLLPQLTELVRSLTDLVRDGTAAADTARFLSTGLDLISSAASFVYTRLDGVGKIIEGLTAGFVEASAAAKKFFSFDFAGAAAIARNSTSDALIKQGLLQALTGQGAARAPSGIDPRFSDVRSRQGDQIRPPVNAGLRDRLQGFFRDPTPSGGSKGRKSGKSDAEKEAEKIAQAIERMTKAQQEWQNELTKTGNPIADEYASRLREITEQAKGFAEDGVPADKVKAFTDEMERLAGSLRDSDIAEFQKEFNEATDQMTANMQGPMKQALLDYEIEVKKIDELLKLGIITIEDYNERMGVLTQQRDAPATDLLKAINEEIMLLGMSAEQQEIYNNLKQAGVDANSAFGQSVIQSTKEMQKARDTAELWNETESKLADSFFDLAKNIGDAENIAKDFFDSIADMILRSIAEDWAGTITDWFRGLGKAQSGSSGTGGGTDWSGLIGSFLGAFGFGGGKASGGSVSRGMFYPVNERGTELLSMGGKDYLMMGSAGNVTPAHALGGGASLTQNNTFMFAAPEQMKTQTQVAAKVAFETRRASARNS